MRTNANVLWVLGVFFWLSAAAYTIWVALVDGWDNLEWVGTVAMFLSGVLAFFLAYYLGLVRKAQGAELPQDLDGADIDDDDPELGHFSPWSWWPLVLGTAVAILFLGLAVGVWVAFIAVPILLVAIVGWTYEYYRNNFAR